MTDRAESSLDNFLDGLLDRVQSERRWPPGIVMDGENSDADSVWHDGEKIPLEQYEARLEHHRETYGKTEGVETINLEVVETEADPFEQEVIPP